MGEGNLSIPSGRPHLGETTIKVPAPFAGVADLGFTAQYREQDLGQPLRDVPLLFEGPEHPLRRLAEELRLLSEIDSAGHVWSDPVMLSDEVIVLAFKDTSLPTPTWSDSDRLAAYVVNLVRPVALTFLHDCASIAHLKLSDVIEMRISAGRRATAQIRLPVRDIVQPNGETLLWA